MTRTSIGAPPDSASRSALRRVLLSWVVMNPPSGGQIKL
ncbi:Uncharacterised protein [Mycobacteroides abscessus subsp. abscessus]|nr:Uncharacterised protein [Mycobacteroides abscessus subsp. abscessus]